MQRFKRGDLKAFELIRDTIGEKPVERVAVSDVPAETMEAVEKLMLGGG